MVVFPLADKEAINILVQNKYPYSRLTVQLVSYQGREYYSIKSTDLDLVAEIRSRYTINNDTVLQSM